MSGARETVARLCGLLAGAALVAMMLLTVVDVSLRAAFKLPIRGTLEIIELLLACTFFFALPGVFLREEHVAVDVVGPRLRPMLKRIAEVIAVALIAVLTWQGFLSAKDALSFGDVTSDLALPRIWYWIPVLAGFAAAGLAAAYMAVSGRKAR
jgi:TRAP-type C4-dicarboxylate transport system permease small subunit